MFIRRYLLVSVLCLFVAAGCKHPIVTDSPELPAGPSDLVAATISSSAIQLSWVDNSDNEIGFCIEETSASSPKRYLTTGANAEAQIASGLTADVQYTFRVCAYNADGDSAYSSPASATTASVGAYVLSIAVSPSGAGTVAKSPNQSSYTSGTVVTLTATAASGYTFSSWSGDASGSSATTTVTMNSNKSVTASFVSTATYTLTVAVSPSGAGTVAKSPNQSSYTSGTVVTLTATAASGYTFSSWSGDASGSSATTTVTMNSNKSVTASFAKVPVLSGPSQATQGFALSWTFAWPGLVSTSDHYEVEWSYSQTSGYQVFQTFPNGVRSSPCTTNVYPEAVDIGKTSYFRVRAYSNSSWTPYSNVVAVYVPYINYTFKATSDNLLMYNSQNSSVANTVYASSTNAVGASYFYDMYGYLFGSLVGATALKFDINNFISGGTIQKATLRLRPYNLPGDFTGTYAVQAYAASWSASSITFNNSPIVWSTPKPTNSAPVTTGLWWEFDVMSMVQYWASGTRVNYGFYIKDNYISPPGYECYRAFDIHSLESSSTYAPELYVEIR
jgi:uncharacterized repeat protein (TIGR02543 family)